MFVAYYFPPKPLPRIRMWIRDEDTPNGKHHADRFPSRESAERDDRVTAIRASGHELHIVEVSK